MTGYQVFLLFMLILWPFVLAALLFGMSRIETFVDRSEAATPEEAGLEPVGGRRREREVKIFFGNEVVPSPGEAKTDGQAATPDRIER
jgi:hypothetical protein